MTCKDCIHYDACADLWHGGPDDFYERFALEEIDVNHNTHCDLFEDKEEYIKLPCKIGCDAWEIITDDDNKPFVHKTRVVSICFEDEIWINTRSEDGLSMSYSIEDVVIDKLSMCYSIEDIGMNLFFDEESAENFVKIRISKNV